MRAWELSYSEWELEDCRLQLLICPNTCGHQPEYPDKLSQGVCVCVCVVHPNKLSFSVCLLRLNASVCFPCLSLNDLRSTDSARLEHIHKPFGCRCCCSKFKVCFMYHTVSHRTAVSSARRRRCLSRWLFIDFSAICGKMPQARLMLRRRTAKSFCGRSLFGLPCCCCCCCFSSHFMASRAATQRTGIIKYTHTHTHL